MSIVDSVKKVEFSGLGNRKVYRITPSSNNLDENIRAVLSFDGGDVTCVYLDYATSPPSEFTEVVTVGAMKVIPITPIRITASTSTKLRGLL